MRRAHATLLLLVTLSCAAEDDPYATTEPVDDDGLAFIHVPSGKCTQSNIRRVVPQSAMTMFERGFDWINGKVTHYCQCVTSQSSPYRADCSGFVSMMWQLDPPGPSSHQFAPFGPVGHVLDRWEQLTPGDALNSDGHVELFAGWQGEFTGADSDTACTLSHGGVPDPPHIEDYHTLGWLKSHGYHPVRKDGYSPSRFPGDLMVLGECVEATAGGDGVVARKRPCDGTTQQSWNLTTSRQIRRADIAGDKCLAAPSNAPGTNVVQRPCDATADGQKWFFEDVQIVGADGKCLRVPDNDWRAGKRVDMAPCSDFASQRWTYAPGMRQIRGGTGHEGLCLTAGDPDVRLEACSDSDLQDWTDGKGGFFRTKAPDRCLDEGPLDGVKITADCDGRLTQRFALRGQVRSQRTNPDVPAGLCLHVQGDGDADAIEVVSCAHTAATVFTFWSTWR